jgi:hypothetical protein
MRLDVYDSRTGGPTTYIIRDVSAVDLAQIQLALISTGQPALEIAKVWVANEPPAADK